MHTKKPINWGPASFLLITLFLSLTATPLYIWWFGINTFQVGLFLFFFAATGFSITAGYHRHFSHLSYEAGWPVRLFTLLFGAAAFEHSVLSWTSDHRRHHKFVDHDGDPYDITKGFFHAHWGWMLFHSGLPENFDNVQDLEADRWVRWQHKFYVPLAFGMGLGLPALIGGIADGWRGALGGFLIAGIARVVFVNHMTFFINSASHIWGRRPYSTRCTARDNGLLAFFTFGEGYHNFHHAFQHDYRNGVKPWQFDPTKWLIWCMHKVGLARGLRRVPNEKILLAEVTEQQARIAAQIVLVPESEPLLARLNHAYERLQQAYAQWQTVKTAYTEAAAAKMKASQDGLVELRRECREASRRLRQSFQEWREACRFAQGNLAFTVG